MKCVYWLFSILITHAGRAEEKEGVTSLAAHCSIFFGSLCFFDISMLNYVCKSIYMVKHFLGQVVYHDYILFQKKML